MTDFQYDSYDQSSLRVAFQNLRDKQQTGFWLGVFVGLPLGFLFNAGLYRFARLPFYRSSALIMSVTTGSIIYGSYTFMARRSYGEVASKVNRKYSNMLSKAVQY